jgi:hypothetical protein
MDRADRNEGLLRWQWSNYPAAHRDRRNLALHLVTAPLFIGGTCAVAAAPFAGAAFLVAGAAAVGATLIAQGRGHKLERNAPYPFRGPGDFAARLFVEQWFTFPRFVLSGGFANAWRSARTAAALSDR